MFFSPNIEKKIIKYSVVTAVLLFVFNLVDYFLNTPSWHLNRFFDLRGEANFPTWFSSLLLVICALYTYWCGLVRKESSYKWAYQALTALFLLMSCDETAQIHEYVGLALNTRFFGLENMYSNWVVIIGLPLFLILIAFAFKVYKIFAGARKVEILLVSGFFIYLYGALFSEILGNFLTRLDMIQLRIMMSFLKEFCEMIGLILLIAGFMKHKEILEES